MKLTLVMLAILVLSGCAQQNVHQFLDNVNKDCVIHGTFSAATGVPAGNVTVAGTIDCQPGGPNATPTGKQP